MLDTDGNHYQRCSYLRSVTGECNQQKMKLFSKVKKEIVVVCALFNCGCRGTTEFRQEFEEFLCDIHHEWATKRRLDDFNF
jgi:hypothetical protein